MNLAILENIVPLEILVVFDSGESDVLVNRGILANIVVLLILLILVNLRILTNLVILVQHQYGELCLLLGFWRVVILVNVVILGESGNFGEYVVFVNLMNLVI